MTREELLRFWVDSSNENHNSMLNMFKSGEYMWSLFLGHLAIEKLLKAYYIKIIDTNIPRTHDLYKLAVKCNLDLTEKRKDWLQYITLFNIETRYEDYKKDFHKKCTKEFVHENIAKIKGLRKWLMEKIEN